MDSPKTAKGTEIHIEFLCYVCVAVGAGKAMFTAHTYFFTANTVLQRVFQTAVELAYIHV